MNKRGYKHRLWRFYRPKLARAYMILYSCGYTHRELSELFDISPATALRWIRESYPDGGWYPHFDMSVADNAKKMCAGIDATLGKPKPWGSKSK